jgi:hypothetical protein
MSTTPLSTEGAQVQFHAFLSYEMGGGVWSASTALLPATESTISFRRYPVQTPAMTPTILTEVLGDFLHSLKADARIVLHATSNKPQSRGFESR